jgi:hypothetical protein
MPVEYLSQKQRNVAEPLEGSWEIGVIEGAPKAYGRFQISSGAPFVRLVIPARWCEVRSP